MFHKLLISICLFLLALALSGQMCDAKEYKIIDGKKVYGQTYYIACSGSLCCDDEVKNKFKNVDFIRTGDVVTKTKYNGNGVDQTCSVFVEDSDNN
jgi:hypothetical protein